MQYELRTQVIEAKRKTFANLTERFGDRPASRYEEGSIDIQAVTNFHYRPLWDPEHEIYDESYSAVRLSDTYSFTDPRQLYYFPYVTARSHLHEAFGSTLSYLDSRSLLEKMPAAWKTAVAQAVIPMRHYESGAQLLAAYGCRFAWGTTIEKCLSYSAFDRIGNAQMLSRAGIALDGGTDALLGEAKTQWLENADLQPLRKYIELLMPEKDWAVALVGLDLMDQLLYGLLYTHLDEAALMGGAGGYSLIAQHFAGWFADQRRWVDALYRAWLADGEHGAANRVTLAAARAKLLPGAVEAAQGVARLIDAQIDCGAADYVTSRAATLAGLFAEES